MQAEHNWKLLFPSEDESDPAGTSRALGCLNKAPNPPAVAHIHIAHPRSPLLTFSHKELFNLHGLGPLQ